MSVLTSGRTGFDDAIIRTEMRSVPSLATTLDEISMLIYDGLQFGNAKLRTTIPTTAKAVQRWASAARNGRSLSVLRRYEINCAYFLYHLNDSNSQRSRDYYAIQLRASVLSRTT